jgi:hypothetical protein
MGTDVINYEAVLADLEARRAQLDSAIAAIKAIMGQAGVMAASSSTAQRITDFSEIASDTFFGLGIAAGTKKLLEMMKRKLSTKEIMEGLRQGGLEPSKYRNVYAILNQRETGKGDIINVNGDWGLAEWYPGRKARRKVAQNNEKDTSSDSGGDSESESADADED